MRRAPEQIELSEEGRPAVVVATADANVLPNHDVPVGRGAVEILGVPNVALEVLQRPGRVDDVQGGT